MINQSQVRDKSSVCTFLGATVLTVVTPRDMSVWPTAGHLKDGSAAASAR
jgi:hypothetical protein